MAAIELFNLYAIDTPCELVNHLTNQLQILIIKRISHIGRMLIILGHLLKTRWQPSCCLVKGVDIIPQLPLYFFLCHKEDNWY